MGELPVVIVGPGALGGLLAATLARSGRATSLLCSGPRSAAFLRRRGITVTGQSEVALPGRAFAGVSHRAAELGPAELVVFCVKSYDLPAALRSARPLLKAPAVACLENGVGHEALFRKAAGSRAVLGAAYVAAAREGPGRIVHGGGKRLVLDAAAGTDALSRTRTVLENAGWKVETAPVRSLLWTKAALNAAVNGLGAVCGYPNGALVQVPPLKDLLEKACAEAQAVLAAADIPVSGKPLAEAAESLCAGTPDNINSTLADLRAGRRTEFDAISGPLLKQARRLRVETPILSALARWVRALETRRGRAR